MTESVINVRLTVDDERMHALWEQHLEEVDDEELAISFEEWMSGWINDMVHSLDSSDVRSEIVSP